ncbi:MAG: homoserine O-succinyltransferase [Xanthomonadaceae bacterium]|nr:homoserine O-succinyltransferase [Xanthomonadaceae bacterium]MDP2186460.1 homoserine O-succinyltransferase [Xanthomonadales bacterium]MDZ4115148.1 homoserine O-succinyltransferase [Xanthomonadaceae bacterium]
MSANPTEPRPCTTAAPELGVQRIVIHGALEGIAAPFDIRYARYGRADAPCIVVMGGISASRRVGDWWAAQVGPGKALDTRYYCVLGFDYLSALPTGWSGISPHDQAAALNALLDALAIERAHALVGASYGGAVALAFAERYPDRLESALVLSMAARPSPMASALRALQRDLLRLGEDLGFQAEAVAMARALAITTYRSDAEFSRRFAGTPERQGGCWRLPVEGYLRAQGERFARQFDADAYRVLSESLDLHQVDPRQLQTALHLLAVDQDRLVPRADIQALARATGASFTCLASDYGHDAFLKEPAAIGDWLAACLRQDLRMRRPALTA